MSGPLCAETTAPRDDADVVVLADYVRRVVDTFPPLAAGQRDRIAALVRGGRQSVKAPVT